MVDPRAPKGRGPRVGAERARLGNAHRMWLRTPMVPWEYVRSIGESWEDYVNGGDPAILERLARQVSTGMPEMQPNLQFCEKAQRYFEDHQQDPRDISADGPFRWSREFVTAISVVRQMQQGDLDLSPERVAAIQDAGVVHTQLLYGHLNVWLCGSQTFEIAAPLAAKLLLTDVGHLTWDEFKLPFPAFVLQVPTGLATLLDPNTGEHEVDTVVVVDGSLVERGLKTRCISFIFGGRENENSKNAGDDANVHASLLCPGGDVPIADAISSVMALDQISQTLQMGGLGGSEATQRLVRFACAIIAYLTDFPEDRVAHVDPEINRLERKIPSLSGKAKRNAKRKVRALLKEPVPYRVGTRVTIDPTLQKVAESVGRGEALPPQVASYVRGHRKMQAHGPGKSLRKPIWVDPYWRGLGDKPTTSKTYSVK